MFASVGHNCFNVSSICSVNLLAFNCQGLIIKAVGAEEKMTKGKGHKWQEFEAVDVFGEMTGKFHAWNY